MFKLQSPSKYSPFDAIHQLKSFFHCSEQFLNLSILMPFSAFAVLFHLFHISKMFPFEDFFHPGKHTQKSCSGQNWVNREGRVMLVLVKNYWPLSTGVDTCAQKLPIMKWANMLRVFKKNSLKLNAASHKKPAGTLTQMGSLNTHLLGEACAAWGSPSRKHFWLFLVPPCTIMKVI